MFYLNCQVTLKEKAHLNLLENMVEIDEPSTGGKMKNKHKGVRNKAHADNISHGSNKKRSDNNEQPLKVSGSFEDVIAASVKNIDVKNRPTKKKAKKKD